MRLELTYPSSVEHPLSVRVIQQANPAELICSLSLSETELPKEQQGATVLWAPYREIHTFGWGCFLISSISLGLFRSLSISVAMMSQWD